jgi:hypothetical protein
VEFILDNLPIVLFIVITIAVRGLQSWIKARNRQNEPPPPVFASTLEPDDDDEEVIYRPEPDERAVIDYSRTRGASAHVVEKARALLARTEEPPRFEALSGASADKRLVPASPPAAVSGPPEEQKQASGPAREPRKLPKDFPYKPGNLSPLQGAVVWAEILGKPKGMV